MQLQYFNNLHLIKEYALQDKPIEGFLIRDAGIEALKNIGVYTLGDLDKIPDLLMARGGGLVGMGQTKIRATQEQLNFYLNNYQRMDLQSFFAAFLSEKEQYIIGLRYGLVSNPETLEAVSRTLNVTRERIRQVEKKALVKIEKGIKYGLIAADVLQELRDYAGRATKYSEISITGVNFRVEGVVSLYLSVLRNEMTLLKHPDLKEGILVKSDLADEYLQKVSEIKQYLANQTEPVDIQTVQDTLAVDEVTIRSIEGITENTKGVVLAGNKKALGLSPLHNVIKTFRQSQRPMTLTELSEQTGYTVTKLRSLAVYSDEIVNVGQSVYALKEHGYLNLDTRGLMKYLLEERSEPLRLNELQESIKKLRRVTDSAILRILYEFPEEFQQLEAGFVALRHWGYENEAEYTPRQYAVKPAEAVVSVMEEAELPLTQQEITLSLEMMYGDETSTNYRTVYAALTRLEREGVIEKTRDGKEVRYELI